MKKYNDVIDYIKNEYGNFYVDRGPENGILQGMRYAGAATHARNCLATLTKMIKPKHALEIGSWHYESSDSIADVMNVLYPNDYSIGVVDSFDIKRGGYDGLQNCFPRNKRVRPGFWYPINSSYDVWKYNDAGIVYPEFRNMKNEDIRNKNIEILDERVKTFWKYDLIFIDGDHSFEGAKEDFDMALKYSHAETLIVIDNVWDIRLKEVRDFYESIQYKKWDFIEWNDLNYHKNMVMDNAVVLPFSK